MIVALLACNPRQMIAAASDAEIALAGTMPVPARLPRIGVLHIADCTGPGQITLTLTPNRAASALNVWESPTTAYLVVLYRVCPGHGIRPLIDAVFTMCPLRCSIISG